MIYSQFHAGQFEDARLREKWTGCPSCGVFVDVGAGNGVTASNTLHFARNGWTGLLVEADPRQLPQLRQNRADTLIEHAAVCGHDGEATLFLTGHLDHASLRKEVWGCGAPHQVPAARLESLLQRNGIGQIDLLSIDVEGCELDVWRSMDWRRHRPTAVIVEHEHGPREEVMREFVDRGYVLIDENLSNFVFLLEERKVNEPLISCLMATYGRHSLVERSLACFLRQDFVDAELVILNNNPVPMRLDPEVPPDLSTRVRIVNEARYSSLGACRNRLLQLARGQYVRTWDDDDIYLPWSLGQGLEGLNSARAANCNVPAWKPTRSWWINGNEPASLVGNAMEASILIRKEIAEKYRYQESGGDEHSPLLSGLEAEGGVAHSELGFWTGYCYMWGQGVHHISGTLGSNDSVIVRTMNWTQSHTDTPRRPLLPNYTAAEEIWMKISKSCENKQQEFSDRCAMTVSTHHNQS